MTTDIAVAFTYVILNYCFMSKYCSIPCAVQLIHVCHTFIHTGPELLSPLMEMRKKTVKNNTQ